MEPPLKNSIVANHPNCPAHGSHNFHEERLAKLNSEGFNDDLNLGRIRYLELQTKPAITFKRAVKQKMRQVLFHR
jgi:hypothetical protein